MRISVVIIVYNLEAYVGQAIESVLEQTRRADEIIVVDDCSTDRSADLVKAYGARLTYLRMAENSGALRTALHGIKAASGDVIAMLDADDYWAGNKLEVVEREFRADPELMLLSHHHLRVDADGGELPIRDDTHLNIASVLRRAGTAAELSNLLRETILAQRGYWLGSAYSFRRLAFDIPRFEAQIAPCGPEWLRQTYLDVAIAPFLVLSNPDKTVGYTSDTTLFYRIHDKGSLAANLSPEKAIQSARRGQKNHELIYLLLRENGAPLNHLERRKLLIAEYDYLVDLYRSEFGQAARLYVRLALNLWNWRQLRKETGRFVAVRLLGPERFLSRR